MIQRSRLRAARGGPSFCVGADAGGAAAAHFIPFLSWALNCFAAIPFEPMLHSNAWTAISARETPVLLGIFEGRLQHSMPPLLWLGPSRYLARARSLPIC
jgi:hypothetical protein